MGAVLNANNEVWVLWLINVDTDKNEEYPHAIFKSKESMDEYIKKLSIEVDHDLVEDVDYESVIYDVR